jgi:hypothetical protein
MVPSEADHSARQHLRNLIRTASHLDGLLCEFPRALSTEDAAIVREDLRRLEQELNHLADDVELRTPRRGPAGQRM